MAKTSKSGPDRGRLKQVLDRPVTLVGMMGSGKTVIGKKLAQELDLPFIDSDARIVDTTMWIAEAVSRFAPADQACAIYASLPNLLDSPPERFTERLDALSQAANCGG